VAALQESDKQGAVIRAMRAAATEHWAGIEHQALLDDNAEGSADDNIMNPLLATTKKWWSRRRAPYM
jgi:hypothetical protein